MLNNNIFTGSLLFPQIYSQNALLCFCKLISLTTLRQTFKKTCWSCTSGKGGETAALFSKENPLFILCYASRVLFVSFFYFKSRVTTWKGLRNNWMDISILNVGTYCTLKIAILIILTKKKKSCVEINMCSSQWSASQQTKVEMEDVAVDMEQYIDLRYRLGKKKKYLGFVWVLPELCQLAAEL